MFVEKYDWKDEYDSDAMKFMQLHYPNGLAAAFPTMRDEYNWGGHRPDVPDSRVTTNNTTEAHVLENYAATDDYEQAYYHWLLAASIRNEQIKVFPQLNDISHKNAIKYCVKNALYNKALTDWQCNKSDLVGKQPPKPEEFDLNPAILEKNQKVLSK